MAAVVWTKLDETYKPLEVALILLKRTFEDGQYRHLSEQILQDKIVSDFLHLWSYGDILDPDASAFFFLRVRHKKVDPQEDQALCLTVGARPYDAAAPKPGLSTADLRTELGVVCEKARTLNARLEVMHAGTKPNFRHPAGNLASVYSLAIDPNAAPPQLEGKGKAIKVEDPWADGATVMKWWKIKEKV
jgi:hypothetical protein